MKESEEILPVSRRDDFNLERKRVSTKMLFVLNDDITSSSSMLSERRKKRTDVIYVNKQKAKKKERESKVESIVNLRDRVSNYPKLKMNSVLWLMYTRMRTRMRVMIDFDKDVELIQ